MSQELAIVFPQTSSRIRGKKTQVTFLPYFSLTVMPRDDDTLQKQVRMNLDVH